MEEKKAVITVIGRDRVGIIARVSRVLMEHHANILDINQTIMNGFFTMMMIVDIHQITGTSGDLKAALDSAGEALGVSITLQDSRVFDAMHRL